MPPWVTDMPPGTGGHYNSRVMREWWDLPTARSTRPFFFRERSGVRENRISRLSGPQPRGSSGDEARNWEELKVFNQAALQDSDFIGNDIRMKNKNNKTEINRWQPRAFKHRQGGRRIESNGNFLHHLHLPKGYYCLRSRHVLPW